MTRIVYKRVATGIDTLEVNASGTLFEWMPELLDRYQENAIAERDSRKGRRRDEARADTCWTLAEQPILMAPHGVGQYHWYLTCPAAIFRIAQNGLNGIAVRVRLSSAFLWEQGYRQAWEMTQEFLDLWGEFTYQPSEVHLCADIAGREASSLRVQDFTRRGHVARWHQEDALIMDIKPKRSDPESSTISLRYGEQEGIAFSPASPHAVVIYNKPREIRLQSRDKLWFADIWKNNGWDGQAPITRVETRYGREVLHEMSIEDMPTLFERPDEMWQYSTQEWIRHTTPEGNKRRTHWPTSGWWKSVQAVTFERQDATPAQREHVRNFHEERVFSTIMGYLESWAGWRAGEDLSPDLDISMVLRAVANRSDDYYADRETNFLEEVKFKRKKMGYMS